MSNPSISIPQTGLDRDALFKRMQQYRAQDTNWRSGKAFCLVYHPGDERAALIKDAYNLFFSENALNPSAFPSLRRFESEVVGMASALLHGNGETEGTMTSGGTESILLAVKTAKEWAKVNMPHVTEPEVIVPASIHPAFNKAFHYFGVKGVIIPVGEDYRVDIKQLRQAINPNTIMLVGSAPSYPHGVIDPIRELSELALQHKILLHVDACVGGFMLPFLRKLGHPIPDFDFHLPGVTSMSADVHKYGYAAKGASVVLYRSATMRKHQFFVHTEWSGGVYGSTTMLGTRPGGAIAAAWAALSSIGINGYLEMAARTMEATKAIHSGISAIPDLYVVGKPDMSIIAFGSKELDIYGIADELNMMGWHFDRQQAPACIHLTISQIHADVYEEFLKDLQRAVDKVKKPSLNKLSTNIQVTAVKGLQKMLSDNAFRKLQGRFSGKSGGENKHGRQAAMYGMMGALSGTGTLEDMVKNVLHGFYTLPDDQPALEP